MAVLTKTVKTERPADLRSSDVGARRLGERAFDPNWAEQAACRTADLSLFFEDLRPGGRGDPYAAAKAVCDSCEVSVRRSCLATAISEGLRSGFFGGSIPARRVEIRKAAQASGVAVTSAMAVADFLANR